jgi:hypothetical protein
MQAERPELAGRSERLSNTLSTYPEETDKHGKLCLIRHKRGLLERFLAQKGADLALLTAPGWDCDRLGCRWCSGPPSH